MLDQLDKEIYKVKKTIENKLGAYETNKIEEISNLHFGCDGTVCKFLAQQSVICCLTLKTFLGSQANASYWPDPHLLIAMNWWEKSAVLF